ncbi:MAG: DNA mismatch repair protein MutS [Spirochaetae bacterium HGW-Spirochaetae-4]|nr:MAG: DNA mismatch repair protein MutS [Spirochaetae bacterium HGW-Spirochaetae-4]
MEGKTTTPMMEQYLELKQAHQGEVLFFRLGDFYEMFMDDAKEVSRLLNLTLTARNGVPMCGIPYHASKNYIKRLLDAGKKIAVCEQVEMPGANRTIARREVVQTITPGTVIEDEFLDAATNNYILTVFLTKEEIACAYCELSSGVFSMVLLPLEDRFDSLRALFGELSPREILVHEEDYFSNQQYAQVIDQQEVMKTRLPSWYFAKSQGFSLLTEHVGTVGLKQFGLSPDDTELHACGALFRYILETSKASLSHIDTFHKVDRKKTLLIDESTRRNLELLTNLQEGSSARTLFSSMDKTCTTGGARLLKSWIASPLATREDIMRRQEWVTWFIAESAEHQRIRTLLGGTRDLSRLATRVAMHRANPQDLVAIQQSIATFFELTERNSDYYRTLLGDHLRDSAMSELVSLMETLLAAIREDCQGPYNPGRVVRQGYNIELDRLRGLTNHGARNLEIYVNRIKEETSIPTIKLSQNRIIGHYLEVPKTHGNKIPTWFYRKQTLVNAERYTTDELIELEQEILASGEKAETLERELFEQLLSRTAELTASLLSLGQFFSTLDCLQSLAQVARIHQYCKPEILDDTQLVIENGRHPVVEQNMGKGQFVANGLSMGAGDERFCLITGPNMAGKSTYLRQNALIVLLAHIGSYVPATMARIGLADKLFCRVGASDNLARGESTFLIEMQEAAFILRTATPRSLAIMDEIGRGTSTQDGMSIAYAVMRSMVAMGVKTLFATHYHELTMLDTSGMQLLTLAVAESKRNIIFLRKIQSGVADSSYGLHVAKMAGIPMEVIRSAAQFQKQHFADYSLAGNAMQLDLFTGSVSEGPLIDSRHDGLLEQIRQYPLEASTPLEAMQFLAQLQEELSQTD